MYISFFQAVVFFRVSSPNPIYTSLVPHTCHMPVHLIVLDAITRRYLVSTHHKAHYAVSHNPLLPRVMPKYLLQHPIIEHPLPMFLPQCVRPRLTPVQNNGLSYSSVLIAIPYFPPQKTEICCGLFRTRLRSSDKSVI